MTSSIPGHGPSVPGSEPRSAPVARISRGALAANARRAWGRGIRSYDPSLLAADAWGHGAELVGEVLGAQGFTVNGTAPSLAPAQLYGLPEADAPVTPALRLTGTVLSVKDLHAGEGVSYGYLYRAAADTRVALVTGGYAQGVVRTLGGAVDVAIAGERHRIVGRVAMDVCVVEIQDASVRRGDDVLFLGDPASAEPSLADWVRESGLGSGELITTVGLRALREVTP